MPITDLTPDDEDQLRNELAQANAKNSAYKASLAPTLAENISEFYRLYPQANLATIVPAAKAFTDGVMNRDQANKFLQSVMMEELKRTITDYNTKKEERENKSWWERNVVDKVKTASRYTFAGLNFVPQFVQGGIAQIFDEDDSVAGWFISTDLGTLIANDEIAGEGYFLGGRAAQLQAERARRYRGEIDGHAWTIGRGVASLVAQPGSTTYNNISGVLDAGAAVLTPSIPGGTAIKGGVKGLSTKTGLRTMAGLTKGASAAIDPKKVADFFSSRSGRQVMERIANIKSIDEAIEVFEGGAEPQFVANLVDVASRTRAAKEAGDTNYLDEMRMFFNDTFGMGDITRGIGPQSIDDINLSRWDSAKLNISQRESKVARLLAKQYGQEVIIAGGSSREMMESIKNVKGVLVASKVNVKDRIKLVDEFARALIDNNGNVGGVVKEIDKILAKQFTSLKVSENLTEQLLNGLSRTRVVYNNRLYGFIDGPTGESFPFADLGGRFITVDGDIVDAPLNTAVLQSEMLKHSLILPDPRRVRRIASQYSIFSAITTKQKFTRGAREALADRFDSIKNAEKYGELRIPFVALEFLQNEIWRPMALATGGYILRNGTDSALRMAFAPEIQVDVFHPFQHIMVATHKRYRGDIEGLLFSGRGEELMRKGHREYAEAVNAKIREGMNVGQRAAREQATGVWSEVRRSDGIPNFTEGVMAETTLLRGDPFVVRLAQEQSVEEIMDWVRAGGRDAQDAVKSIQTRWQNVEYVDPATNQTRVVTYDFFRKDGSINEVNVEKWIRSVGRTYLDKSTGNIDILKQIVANGKFTDAKGRVRNAFEYSKTGEITGYTKAFKDEVRRIVEDPNSRLKDVYKRQIYVGVQNGKYTGVRGDIVEAWDKGVDVFFGHLYGRSEAFLNRSPAFRQFYYAQINRFLDELRPGEAEKIIDNIASSATREIEQDLRRLGNLKPDSQTGLFNYNGRDLTRGQVDDIISERTEDLANAKKKVQGRRGQPGDVSTRFIAKYVGDKDVANTLVRKANGDIPSTGNLTLEEVNYLAKGYALDETKRLFYNASQKSNFGDVFRIIAPFGSAWYEVMRRWSRDIARNPEILKRFGNTVQGLQDADPDNDGKGFFWRDPTTGEYQFNYPFSKELAPFMAGVTGFLGGAAAFGPIGAVAGGAAGVGTGLAIQPQLEGLTPQFVAPVKSLNMGLQIYPGMGPFVQVPASWALKNKPDLNWFRDMVLPYGEPDVSLITFPSWGQKFAEAVMGDPETDRMLGDLKIDVMRALNATGEYDLTTEEGKLELENDAEDKARWLLGFRALGQMVGPSRPKIDFVVETKQGDKMATEISRLFYKYREENNETAVQRLMQTLGDDLFLYTTGKSRAAAGGLDGSREFENWMNDNKTLFEKYPEVAGYFGPVGSKFDYKVFVRQFETSGLREKIKPSEFIDIAQEIVGRAAWRFVLNQFPAKLSQLDRDIIKDERERIYEQFPGYAKSGVNVQFNADRIRNLERAVANAPELAGNPVAEAAAVYFDERNKRIAEAYARNRKTLAAQDNADLRGQLRIVGEELARLYPEFERLWDDVLFREVDEED